MTSIVGVRDFNGDGRNDVLAVDMAGSCGSTEVTALVAGSAACRQEPAGTEAVAQGMTGNGRRVSHAAAVSCPVRRR